jgi:hypothetical protein
VPDLVGIQLCPANPAVLVRPSRADRVLITAGLGRPDVDLIDAGVLLEAVPQAVEVIEATSLAGHPRDDEAAPGDREESLSLGETTKSVRMAGLGG